MTSISSTSQYKNENVLQPTIQEKATSVF